MRVEQYDPKHYDAVLAMLEEFCKEYVSEFDPHYVSACVEEVLKKFDADKGFVLVNDKGEAVGLLGGNETRLLQNRKRVFHEIAWYVRPTYGKYAFWFVDEIESRLKAQGYEMFVMAVLNSPKADRIKKIYQTMGFQYMESHFIKHL